MFGICGGWFERLVIGWEGFFGRVFIFILGGSGRGVLRFCRLLGGLFCVIVFMFMMV